MKATRNKQKQANVRPLEELSTQVEKIEICIQHFLFHR